MISRLSAPLVAAACLLPSPAWATAIGLNQIVTPDIQPVGQVAVSYLHADPRSGTRTRSSSRSA